MLESTINALLTRVEERLPELLSAVWDDQAEDDADRGEFIDLVTPVSYTFGRLSEGPYEFPAIRMWEEENSATSTGPTTGGDMPEGWTEFLSTIIVMVCLQHVDELVLERQLTRYRRAVWQFISENQILSGESATLTLRRIGRESPTARLQVKTPGVRGLFFEVTVDSQETF